MTELEGFITSYILDVEWLLTWFPIRSASGLQKVKIRGAAFSHRNTADVFVSGGNEVHFLGQGSAAESDGDQMHPSNLVGASITVGVVGANDLTFNVKVEVFNGGVRRRKKFILEDDVTTPFMLNVPFQGEDELLGDSVVTLQGLFVAGPRFVGENPPPTLEE